MAWEAFEDDMTNIKLQRITAPGALNGDPFYAENGYNASADKHPHVDFGTDGTIGAVWVDAIEGMVRFRAFDAVGNPEAASATELLGSYKRVGEADVAVSRDGAAHVVWTDDRHDYRDVYLRSVTGAGELLGTLLRVNALGSLSAYPAVSLSVTQSYGACVWATDGDILAQFFDGVSSFSGANRLVNADSAGTFPDVAVGDGTALVVWEDSSAGLATRIYCQAYDGTSKRGTSLALSNVGTVGALPSVAATANRYLVTWEHTTAARDTPVIRGQYLTTTGAPSGENFSISAFDGIKCEAPAVAGNKSGLAAVVWHTNQSGTMPGPIPIPVVRNNVYLRLYDRAGTAVTGAIKVNDGGSTAYDPAVTVDSSGRVGVVWLDSRGEQVVSHVYCRFYSSDGTPTDTNFRVDSSTSSCRNVRCAMSDDGALMVVWQDVVTEDVVSRTIDTDGAFLTGEVRHNNVAVNMSVATPGVAAGHDGALLVWTNSVPDDVSQRAIWGEFSTLTSGSGVPVTPVARGGRFRAMAAEVRAVGFDLLGRRIGLEARLRSGVATGIYITPQRGGRRRTHVR